MEYTSTGSTVDKIFPFCGEKWTLWNWNLLTGIGTSGLELCGLWEIFTLYHQLEQTVNNKTIPKCVVKYEPPMDPEKILLSSGCNNSWENSSLILLKLMDLGIGNNVWRLVDNINLPLTTSKKGIQFIFMVSKEGTCALF